MFDIAWSEYLVVIVVALVLLGPKELPIVLRTLGRWVAKARQFSSSLEKQMYALGNQSSLEPTSPSEVFIDKPASDLPLLYQKVFFKQHQNKRFLQNIQSFKTPYPKPWL